jgi:hypothetical protein
VESRSVNKQAWQARTPSLPIHLRSTLPQARFARPEALIEGLINSLNKTPPCRRDLRLAATRRYLQLMEAALARRNTGLALPPASACVQIMWPSTAPPTRAPCTRNDFLTRWGPAMLSRTRPGLPCLGLEGAPILRGLRRGAGATGGPSG